MGSARHHPIPSDTHSEQVGAALGLLPHGRGRAGSRWHIDTQLLLAGAGCRGHGRGVITQAPTSVTCLQGGGTRFGEPRVVGGSCHLDPSRHTQTRRGPEAFSTQATRFHSSMFLGEVKEAGMKARIFNSNLQWRGSCSATTKKSLGNLILEHSTFSSAQSATS